MLKLNVSQSGGIIILIINFQIHNLNIKFHAEIKIINIMCSKLE